MTRLTPALFALMLLVGCAAKDVLILAKTPAPEPAAALDLSAAPACPPGQDDDGIGGTGCRVD